METAHDAYQSLCHVDDMTMLACQLSAAAKVYDRYRTVGISEEIYISTMKCFTRFLQETYRRTGEWRYDRAFWTYRQTSMVLFRIGQLEYELCSAPKTVSIHIPSDADFTPKAVEDSLIAAYTFLETFHPKYKDCSFICHSWLLSPELGKLLPETSNILNFQRRFKILSVQDGEREFMQWLFETDEDTPAENLREKTSLQRKVKLLLLSGGNIGAARGILK